MNAPTADARQPFQGPDLPKAFAEFLENMAHEDSEEFINWYESTPATDVTDAIFWLLSERYSGFFA